MRQRACAAAVFERFRRRNGAANALQRRRNRNRCGCEVPRRRWRQAERRTAERAALPRHGTRGQKRRSRPISRVLSLNSHSSRPCVAARLEQPTRERRGPRQCSPIWSCSEWGLPCHATLSSRAVRSYRTVSPSPRTPRDAVRLSVLCCTDPSAHAAQALPGTLPCGARTFLETLARLATVWPTPRVV